MRSREKSETVGFFNNDGGALAYGNFICRSGMMLCLCLYYQRIARWLYLKPKQLFEGYSYSSSWWRRVLTFQPEGDNSSCFLAVRAKRVPLCRDSGMTAGSGGSAQAPCEYLMDEDRWCMSLAGCIFLKVPVLFGGSRRTDARCRPGHRCSPHNRAHIQHLPGLRRPANWFSVPSEEFQARYFHNYKLQDALPSLFHRCTDPFP